MGGGLSKVLRVARRVLVMFLSSSIMAAAVLSSKNNWYERAGNVGTKWAIGTKGPADGMYCVQERV